MTDDFISYCETRFRDYIRAEYPRMEILFSNLDAPSDETFVVLHVMVSDLVIPLSLGKAADSRNVGFLQIDIYTKKNIGTGLSRRIAKYAATIFQRHNAIITTEGNATFKDCAIMDRGEVRGRHKREIRVAYSYDFKMPVSA
jgi:hypothetical protein